MSTVPPRCGIQHLIPAVADDVCGGNKSDYTRDYVLLSNELGISRVIDILR